jgi:hypothetical protein
MLSYLQKKIKALPTDIQNIIISYTYSPQKPCLLQDIISYNQSLEILNDFIDELEIQNNYYFFSAKDQTHNELLNYLFYYICDDSMNSVINIFWKRDFMYKNMHNKKTSYLLFKTFYQRTIDSQIRIIWGLLTLEERFDFIDCYSSELYSDEEDDDF